MKKKVFILLAIIAVVVIQSTSVLASRSQQTGMIGEVDVRVSNEISDTKRIASAITWTSSPDATASVNATFYWTDYDNTYMGSTYKSTGNHGSAGVYGIGTEQNRDVYYYKVISNHSATYNGGSYSYSNLTVFDP